MSKILFLPFLQIQTGHHKVADALIRSLETRLPNATLKKVDVLSYTHQNIEKAFRHLYIKWINYLPMSYKHIYNRFVYPSTYPIYIKSLELFFQDKMLGLISEEEPDLIVCTQALPSLLLSKLKEQGKLKTPVINVYTDFFVNEVWGYKGIDYHFVPDNSVRNYLQQRYKVLDHQILVTGIPIDESFAFSTKTINNKQPYHILVSGGNCGLGDITTLLKKAGNNSEFVFYILCGNNRRLFEKLASWGVDHIKPFPYLASSSEVSRLYHKADAIITKPGGVTISEALQMRLPIFVHSTLPGQEEVNLRYLTAKRLVYPLNQDQSIKEQLLKILEDESELNFLHQRVKEYNQEYDTKPWEKIIEILSHKNLANVKGL